MDVVLLKALSFVLIIILGYVIKKLVFKNPKDHQIIAFLLLNVTRQRSSMPLVLSNATLPFF